MPSLSELDDLRARLRRLALDSAAFREAFDAHCWRAYPEWVDNSAEEPVLSKAVALAESLHGFDGSDVSTFRGLDGPRVIQEAVRKLRDAFDALTGRWGWSPALGADGPAYIRERRERYKREHERPYYEAALSLCPVDATWNATADQGESLVYGPTMTPEEAAGVMGQLYRDLRRVPIHGSSLPHGNAFDIDPIEKARRVIEWAGRPADPPPEAAPHLRAGEGAGDEPAPLGPPSACEQATEQAERSEAPTDEDVDATINALLHDLGELIPLTFVGNLPEDLDEQWAERSDPGIAHQFGVWHRLIRLKYALARLPSPVPDYPDLARIEFIRLRSIIASILDRAGASELAKATLEKMTPIWNADEAVDWKGADLPGSLLLLNEAEHRGLWRAIHIIGEAYDERHQAPDEAPPPATPQRPEMKKQGKSRVPKDEAEIRVRDWLLDHARENPANVTRDAVAAGTGVSAGGVSGTAAWRAFRERRDAVSNPVERNVPLTDGMLAAVPGDDSMPDELAALIEEQQREAAEDARRHAPS